MQPNRRPTRLLASDLACVRGGRGVFSRLSFAVGAGEALLVSGPNGAGKSSLLRAVAGLVRLTAGQLTLEGGDGEATIGEQAHYLGHQDALKPSLTVAENLDFWARYLDGGATITAALDAVGLGSIASLPAAYLSAGQRRRLSIARLVGGRAPALAARRADLRARCGGADDARRPDAQSSRCRRHDPRRHPRTDRIGWCEGIAIGRRGMMALLDLRCCMLTSPRDGSVPLPPGSGGEGLGVGGDFFKLAPPPTPDPSPPQARSRASSTRYGASHMGGGEPPAARPSPTRSAIAESRA